MRVFASMGLVTTTLFVSSAFAGARDDLSQFTQNLQGLDGQFVQQVFDTNGKLKESSTGQVAMSVPRLFRWEYVKPYAQLIVADGETVWVYDPDLEQVTRRPQGIEEQNSPLAALIDPAKLDRDFMVAEAADKDGLSWLTLAPRQQTDASFRSAQLGFAESGLVRMEVIDTLGQRTLFAFSNWRRNPQFAAGTFRYVPPKGVDVVGAK